MGGLGCGRIAGCRLPEVPFRTLDFAWRVMPPCRSMHRFSPPSRPACFGRLLARLLRLKPAGPGGATSLMVIFRMAIASLIRRCTQRCEWIPFEFPRKCVRHISPRRVMPCERQGRMMGAMGNVPWVGRPGRKPGTMRNAVGSKKSPTVDTDQARWSRYCGICPTVGSSPRRALTECGRRCGT